MLVYRVEHEKTGEGPYAKKGAKKQWEDGRPHDLEHGRPTPFVDSNKNMQEFARNSFHIMLFDYVFGFTTMAQYRKWFSKEERIKLKKNGFIVKKYKIKKRFIIVGDQQCMFKKKEIENGK